MNIVSNHQPQAANAVNASQWRHHWKIPSASGLN